MSEEEFIGDEKDIKNISMRNDWLERECENLVQKEGGIAQNLQLAESLTSQMEKFKQRADQIIDKNTLEVTRKSTAERIQISNNSVDAAFLKLEDAQNSCRLPEIPNFSTHLKIQFEESIKLCELEIAELEEKSKRFKLDKEVLKNEHEAVLLERASVSKNIKKIENENSMLKSLLKQQKVKHAENRLTAEIKKKAEAEKELEAAKKVLEESRKTVNQKKLDNKKIHDQLEAATSLIAKIESENLFDIESLREMAMKLEDHDLNVLLAEASAFFRTKPLVPPFQKEITPDDTVKILRKRLSSVSKERQLVQEKIEFLNQHKDRRTVASELLKRKISGLEALEKQIAENSELLAKSTRHARENEARRMFELAANEVPGPRIGRDVTPENHKKPELNMNMKLAKRVRWSESTVKPTSARRVLEDSLESSETGVTQTEEFGRFFGETISTVQKKKTNKELNQKDDSSPIDLDFDFDFDDEIDAGNGDYLEQSTWNDDD